MTDFRALCEELAEALDECQRLCGDQPESPLVWKSRAALAEQPVEPTDEELLELMPETMQDEFSYAATTCSNVTGGQVSTSIFRVCLNTAALDYARAVLARWGQP